MPLNVNNVDATVVSNAIYGMTVALLSDKVTFSNFFDRIIDVYEDSTDFIVFNLENDFFGRKDLALLYYPSKYNAYWFISRTLFILNNNKDNFPSKYSSLLEGVR